MTDESRKAFEAQCLSSLIGYTTITGRFEYTDTTTQDQWVIWQRAWQARDAELTAKDARIAELESALRIQANAAKTLAYTSKEISSVQLAAAKKLNAESNPDGLNAERAANERLTNELEAVEVERDQLRATLAAIEREVGERPERLDTDSDAVYEMALSDHYKHAAEHAALRVVEAEARIDALMFEHCPDEMTDEQKQRWAKSQAIAANAERSQE